MAHIPITTEQKFQLWMRFHPILHIKEVLDCFRLDLILLVLLVLFFLYPWVYSSQGLKQKSYNQSWSDYWSGTSSITKVLCRRTELKRCSDTDRRWLKKNDDARSSPEKLLSLWPKSLRNSKVDKLKAPRFSTAIGLGWKVKLDARLEYFANFRSTEISALCLRQLSSCCSSVYSIWCMVIGPNSTPSTCKNTVQMNHNTVNNKYGLIIENWRNKNKILR